MIEEINCVIKTLKDKSDNIVWEALYLNSEKQIEDICLNKEQVNEMFNKGGEYKEYIINENEYDISQNTYREHFKDTEDFSHLLDYTEPIIGGQVILDDGSVNIIKEIVESYRIAGYYPTKIWFELDNTYTYNIDNMFYTGHIIREILLENGTKIIWEDYNYQQSFLYLKFK